MQLSIYEKQTLVSVLHIDVTGTSMSAVYCYYDTALSDRSLGTFSILSGLEYAKKLKVSYCYLGYAVKGNPHMAYKIRYRPNEILTGNGWVPFCDRGGEEHNGDMFAEGFPGIELRTSRPFAAILLDDCG